MPLAARASLRSAAGSALGSLADSVQVRVEENEVSGVRYGLHYMYSDDNRFEANAFRDNAAGAALMYSKGIVLRDNRFLANRNHRAYGLLLARIPTGIFHGGFGAVMMGIWLVGRIG